MIDAVSSWLTEKNYSVDKYKSIILFVFLFVFAFSSVKILRMVGHNFDFKNTTKPLIE